MSRQEHFYMDTSLGVLELTATTEIQVTDGATITRHTLEDGSEIADHIVNENSKISFTGVISDIKRITSGDRAVSLSSDVEFRDKDQLNVQEWIELLSQIRRSKERFSVVYDSRLGVIPDCVLTSVTKSRNSSTGTGYNINIAFEQIRVVARATTSVRRDDQLSPDESQDKSNSQDSSTRRVTLSTAGVGFDIVVGGKGSYVVPEDGGAFEPLTPVDEENPDG